MDVPFSPSLISGSRNTLTYPGANANDPKDPRGDKAYYSQFEETKGFYRVDFHKGETDPYFGAKWKGGNWVDEGATTTGTIGNGLGGINATMIDSANSNHVSRVTGNHTKEFETFAVCIDTGEILGGITWGYEIKNKNIQLTGGEAGNVLKSPSMNWQSAVAQWNKNPAGIEGMQPIKEFPK